MINYAYVAFGSNEGDRIKNLAEVMKEFGQRGIHLRRMAKLYASKPAESVAGEIFLNTVLECGKSASIETFFEVLQRIELSLGSLNKKNGASRTCDLDLLLWGNLTSDSIDLTIPHPRIAQRDFVLRPLCDLIPDEIMPGTMKRFSELLAECKTEFVLRVVER
ncbi:MAG: 2-amino-4-hydroxy-6-hydroxymethyldihydropteridine diphosphokinase [Calditrichaeota bacterium]|nr:2-amino-4-hydroxy-6-hydroxymethyldihydropteridine diphosphokinase [Calditrichota bacterium]MCB9367913.1 2-amino-4-hydroxy-6-hydroxymethyldihydropteridine diphosphokinase [Calditrichota bacterium]